MTPSDIVGAVCGVAFVAWTVAIVVGETYHRHRKRRWKRRVQRFHEQQAQAAALPASHDEAN
jgi:hypothetical protein